MSSTSLTRAARSVTAPVRGYINNHFEMVKQEVRDKAVHVDLSELGARLAELEATVSESGLHQARLIAELRDHNRELTERVTELERLVERLADVVAAATLVTDDQPV